MDRLAILCALLGGGISTVVMMHFWLPRPVPILRYITVLLAGIVAGIVAGYLMHVSDSNPMPGIFASLGAGLITSGAVTLFGGGTGHTAMS